MKVRWTPHAVASLESIYLHLCEHYPDFAESTARRLYDCARSLGRTPERGWPGMTSGTREFVVPRLPYSIVYRVAKDGVEVLHLYSSGQDR